MAKKQIEKTYNLEDFFTATLNGKPSNMPLLLNGEDTGQYLSVIGSESHKLKKAIAEYRRGYKLAKAYSEEALEANDTAETDLLISDRASSNDDQLAIAMIEGWSFNDYNKESVIKLLQENTELSNSVIAFSFDNGNYCAKK